MSRKSRNRRPVKVAPTSVRGNHPPRTAAHTDARPSAEDTGIGWDRHLRGWSRFALVAAIGLAGWLVWPQITLPFSGVAPIVADLQADSVYVEDGADVPADTEQRVRDILGRRPAAVIVLARDSTYSDRPLDICTAVVDRVKDVEVMVTRVGSGFAAQCQGADLPVRIPDVRFDAGLAFSLDIATQMFNDDIPGQAEQLALIMDSAVKSGRLADTERVFRAPVTSWLAAGGIVIGVVGGAVLLFWGVRSGGRAVVARRRRRAEFRSRYEDVEATVSEAALVLLAIDPQDAERTATAAALAGDYRVVLDDLGTAHDADDLARVEQRAADILQALQQAAR